MAGKRVITERDIAQAIRSGERTLDVADAIVTPSARDAAQRARLTFSTTTTSKHASAGVSKHAKAGVPLRIALGADHGGVSLKEAIAARLRELGHDVTDVGTTSTEPVDYPDFAVAVARRVAEGRADFGIMVDGAGIGSCMAANKVSGVRAAMCHDITTAQNAREHNSATVLTLGGGLLGTRLALAIVEAFLATPFAGGRHAPRVAKIDALDRSG